MKRLKYVSQYSTKLTKSEIDELIHRASVKNARLGVTGILMTSGKLFYQLIEGPTASVDALFDEISQDQRHRDVVVLSTEERVRDRAFPDWSMKKIQLDDDAAKRLAPMRKLVAEIASQRIELARKTNQVERAIWHELADQMEDPRRDD